MSENKVSETVTFQADAVVRARTVYEIYRFLRKEVAEGRLTGGSEFEMVFRATVQAAFGAINPG